MIQIISDTHFEFLKELPGYYNASFVTSPYLFCAGDIGIPLDDTYNVWKNFFKWADKSYTKVFYVLGNHESYGFKFERTKEYVEQFFKEQTANCILLTKDVVETITLNSKEYKVVGCTLWTEVDEISSGFLNDTKMIIGKGVMPISSEQIRAWHQEDKNWLKVALLQQNQESSVIVMTHHLPSFKLIHPKYKHLKFNSGFASNCDDLIVQSCLWLFGHSHTFCSKKIGDVLCYSNPLGYIGENSVEKFCSNHTLQW